MAQWLGRRISDQGVPGSNPSRCTFRCGLEQVTFDVTHNTGVTLRCASKRRFQHFLKKPKGLQGDVAIQSAICIIDEFMGFLRDLF